MLLLAVVAMLVTACSGSDSDGVASLEAAAGEGSDVVEPAPEVDSEQAMLDLAACLRENGIEIEDPTVDAAGNVEFGGFRGAAANAGVDRETMRAAMDTCAQNLEGVSLGRGGDEFDITEIQDTMVEFAACMRSNGYDMPDPDLSDLGPGAGGGQGEGGGPFGEIDPADPDFIAAEAECGEIISGFRGPGAGRGGQES